MHCTGTNSLVLGATVEQPVVPPGGPHHALVQTRRVEQVLALHPQIVPGFLCSTVLGFVFKLVKISVFKLVYL